MLRLNLLLHFLFFASLPSLLYAVHESLNFVLEAKSRQCFFEDFEKDGYAKLIEVFVEAGGSLAVQMEIFGPLSAEDVKVEHFGRALVSESISPERYKNLDGAISLHSVFPTHYLCSDPHKINHSVCIYLPNSYVPIVLYVFLLDKC